MTVEKEKHPDSIRLEKIQDEILIAEFDGWYQDKERCKFDGAYFHAVRSCKLTDKVLLPTYISSFKYRYSWDWIIPVCNKILKIIKEDKLLQDQLMKDENFIVKFGSDLLITITLNAEYSIAHCWIKIIDFIKFYNRYKSISKHIKQ